MPDLDQLRKQARLAVSRLLQMVLDHPANRGWQAYPPQQLARTLWQQGLLVAYRLLFLLKREGDYPGETPTPATDLVAQVEAALQGGAPCEDIEQRLRSVLCNGFVEDHVSGEAAVGDPSTPTLWRLAWGDDAVGQLIEQLLWVPAKGNRAGKPRRRIDLAALAIEDLGHIYEGLLELEPGIATEPMCRLRRQKLEVVVPAAEGEKYRHTSGNGRAASKVQWVEAIPAGRFYLRASLARKASGTYFTPHTFVQFLVRQTLQPQLEECSPVDDPWPAGILELKVLDPAMGSGHFLVEACRFLGEKLYDACQYCVQQATASAAPEEAQQWRQRVISLPLGAELLACLTGERKEGNTVAESHHRALAICRRLVAEHCLYGVDKNPLAVELARLALWLVAHVPGLPSVRLDRHLVAGDALTGPSLEHLFTRPNQPKRACDDYSTPELQAAFRQALADALQRRRWAAGDHAHADDSALLPFRLVAAAWSGGVMLGPGRCDDAAYRELLGYVAAHGCWPDRMDAASLRTMLARGLGVDHVPEDGERLKQLVRSGLCVPALAYELAFPEVFYPGGDLSRRQGFHAVLGNPPWEAVRPRRGEFFGSFDLEALTGYTKRERVAAETRLLENPAVARLHETYLDEIEGQKHCYDALYRYQKLTVDGSLAGRYLDQYRVFMERSAALVRQGGRVGLVVPAAFRANAGAVGVRRFYLIENCLNCCYTFRNTRQLFEISAGMQFCLIVATFGRGPTQAVEVAFDLEDDQWLFASDRQPRPLTYPLALIHATGGAYLTMVNLPGERELRLMLHLAGSSQPLGESRWFKGIQFQTNPAALNATKDSWRLEETRRVCQGDPRDPEQTAALLAQGYVPLHEKGTIARYHAQQRAWPRYLVNLLRCADRPDLAEQLRYYRLMGRSAIHASEPEKAVFALIPPGGLVSNSAMVEAAPLQRPNAAALVALAVLNSHTFNYLAAQQVVLNLNLFILRNLRVPSDLPAAAFLAHGALRLSANDAAYAPLWEEQLGTHWREPGQPAFSWPALATERERAAAWAALDAVVALAYGMSRDQYAYILAAQAEGWPGAAAQCLACFDAIQAQGLAAFMAAHDPYHDLPLVDALPQPVLDAPAVLSPAGRAS